MNDFHTKHPSNSTYINRILFRYRASDITEAEGKHISRIQVSFDGLDQARQEQVAPYICNNIDRLIWCQFVNTKQAELSFDKRHLDKSALLTAIQRLGYSVKFVEANETQIELRIEGMHCNSCVNNIRDAVLDLPGAINIQLTFLEKVATITYDLQLLQSAKIIKEIENLGFQVIVENSSQGKIYQTTNSETGKGTFY